MAMDIPTLRKLVALDEKDPLSRFALGKKLFEEGNSPEAPNLEALNEAAGHLSFANETDPSHLATYHIYGQVLIKLGRGDEAKRVLEEGVRRVSGVGGGMGRDLGPAMSALLSAIP